MGIADADGTVLHYYHISPIGSVVAWLKDYTNTPALGEGWVECNGQTLSDSESPFDGQTIPDLNSAVDTDLKGRFLRGHTSSGEVESSQNLAHTHDVPVGSTDGNGFADGANNEYAGVGTTSSGGTEARPYNYSVVWIMRIK